jgi:hypothetical protein
MTSRKCSNVVGHLLECGLVYKEYWDNLTLLHSDVIIQHKMG